MAKSERKVEVRFGAFSCSIEGYDDPVAQLREILGMMQKTISETPALAEAAQHIESELAADAPAGTREHFPPPIISAIRIGSVEDAETAEETGHPLASLTDGNGADAAGKPKSGGAPPVSDIAGGAADVAHGADVGEPGAPSPTAGFPTSIHAEERDSGAPAENGAGTLAGDEVAALGGGAHWSARYGSVRRVAASPERAGVAADDTATRAAGSDAAPAPASTNIFAPPRTDGSASRLDGRGVPVDPAGEADTASASNIFAVGTARHPEAGSASSARSAPPDGDGARSIFDASAHAR